MRSNITVHVPQNEEISYSLYARGFLSEKPQISSDGKEAELKFFGGTAVVLFYYFQGFKRAYVVTSWNDEKDGDKIRLPGVDQDLCIIYTASAGKIRTLERFIIHFSKDDEYALFRLPLLFWYRFSTLIQCRMGKLSCVQNLVNHFSHMIS